MCANNFYELQIRVKKSVIFPICVCSSRFGSIRDQTSTLQVLFFVRPISVSYWYELSNHVPTTHIRKSSGFSVTDHENYVKLNGIFGLKRVL